jgi:hypothetical protein
VSASEDPLRRFITLASLVHQLPVGQFGMQCAPKRVLRFYILDFLSPWLIMFSSRRRGRGKLQALTTRPLQKNIQATAQEGPASQSDPSSSQESRRALGELTISDPSSIHDVQQLLTYPAPADLVSSSITPPISSSGQPISASGQAVRAGNNQNSSCLNEAEAQNYVDAIFGNFIIDDAACSNLSDAPSLGLDSCPPTYSARLYDNVELLLPKADNGRRFVSPFSWIQDWSAEYATELDWANVFEMEALRLPSYTTIQKLFRLYFIYFSPSFPIIGEYEIQLMVDAPTHSSLSMHMARKRTLSLALVNAMLFIASGVRRPTMLVGRAIGLTD